MHPEIQKLLNQVNGSPVRISSTRFACLWDPPLDFRRAVVYMRNLLTHPPTGFEVEEIEGRKVTLEIRRLNH